MVPGLNTRHWIAGPDGIERDPVDIRAAAEAKRLVAAYRAQARFMNVQEQSTARGGRIRKLDKLMGGMPSAVIRMHFGNCPAGCPGDSVIYRSSARSMTMRCNSCGMLWTMTIHQMAKSMRAIADGIAADDSEPDPELVALGLTWADVADHANQHAKLFEDWDRALGENRGKVKPVVMNIHDGSVAA